jgi:hypothetical protein
MSVEDTVRTWAAAWSERDPARRAELVEKCFAATGRFVTRANVVIGRVPLAQFMAAMHERTGGLTARINAPIDVQGSLFRVRAVAERDGVVIGVNWDAGEVDSDGRISTVFTFAEPLAGD